MSIRPASSGDYQHLVALFTQQNCFNHNTAPDRVALTDDLLTESELSDMLADPDTCLLVASSGPQLCAVLLGRLIVTNASRWQPKRCFAYLDELLVTQSERGKGIAASLVDQFEDWATERGATCIDLHVWQHNTGAIECYQKLGFYDEQRLMTKNLE